MLQRTKGSRVGSLRLAYFPYHLQLLINLRFTQPRQPPPPIQHRCSILDTQPSPARSRTSTTQTIPRPPSPQIDDTLRHPLVCFDDEAQTGQPWARNFGRASALLAFFDLEPHVLRIVNTGPGHVFLGRHVSYDTNSLNASARG